MEINKEEIDFTEIMTVLTWNRRLLSISGIWPLKVCDPLFLYSFVYICFHIVLGFLHLIDHPPTLDHVVTTLTETIAAIMAFCKLTVYRLNSESIAQTIIDIQKNIVNETYRTKEERLAFLSYNRLSLKFIQIIIPSVILMCALYAITRLVPPTIVVDNSTVEYRMLYNVRPIVKPHDTISYIFATMYQMLLLPIVISTYIGTDCLFSSSAIQITSQFAVLRCKVTQVLRNSNNHGPDIKKLVFQHLRLIRLAETFENDFNIYICQQMIGTTFNLCICGYHALVSSKNGETIKFVVFFLYGIVLLATLLSYCYVGECLIEESMGFSESLYLSNWYEISPMNLKMICICMIRGRIPLQLTSAKFFALSLNTFTDILKTSMGYLSVLKTLL